MKSFNLLYTNFLKEVDSTNNLDYEQDYEQERKNYKGMIELCFAHGPYGSPPAGYGKYSKLDGWEPYYDYIPEYVERFTKDPEVQPLITELFVKGYPISDLHLYEFVNEKLKEVYHKSRPNIIKKLSEYSKDLESAKEVSEFTGVDEYLCSLIPQFAKDCGELFYKEYGLTLVKRVLSKDEEDDISNW